MSDKTCIFDSPTVTKLCTAWLVAPLDKIATTLAMIYTFLLISEWFWKRLWRPFLENRGVLQRRRRRAEDDTYDESNGEG